ncbi:helix-turn-helix domain-containing protein [Bacillota bacterium Meth-B3]
MERLKLLRKKRNLPQVALSIETGIDQSQISKYERGERIPSTGDLLLLADFFGTSLDYLMNRTDNPTRRD